VINAASESFILFSVVFVIFSFVSSVAERVLCSGGRLAGFHTILFGETSVYRMSSSTPRKPEGFGETESVEETYAYNVYYSLHFPIRPCAGL
jgi:hypothetical protein